MKAAFEIGPMLNSLDPELIKNYENRNYKGCPSLEDLKQKYYTYILTDKRVTQKIGVCLIVMTVSVLVGIPLALIISKQFLLIPLVTTLGLLSFTVSYVIVTNSYKKKFVERYLHAVKEFCEAAEAIQISRYRTRIVTKETVEAELVGRAFSILDQEEKFDIMCNSGHSYVREILDHGHKILEHEEKLHRALESAAKFGLVFEKRELFNKAQARFRKL